MPVIVPRQCPEIHTTSGPWTGAPGSPWRTWAEKDGRSPTIALAVPSGLLAGTHRTARLDPSIRSRTTARTMLADPLLCMLHLAQTRVSRLPRAEKLLISHSSCDGIAGLLCRLADSIQRET